MLRHLYLSLLAALAVLGITACSTPQAEPHNLPPLYTEQMANTPANVADCVAAGGTPLRDPQPPRPQSDPGPTFICDEFTR